MGEARTPAAPHLTESSTIMTAWITGYAMGPYMPNPDNLQVHLTRDEAIEALKDEMKTFAEEQDQPAYTDEYASDEDFGRCEAHWGAIWAHDGPATPQIAAGGEIHLTLDDASDYAWNFWAVESTEKWFNFPEIDDEPRTAEDALQEWIETFEPEDDDETELLMESTDRTADAAFNIRAIASAATYHGIDLDARNYPLPKEI